MSLALQLILQKTRLEYAEVHVVWRDEDWESTSATMVSSIYLCQMADSLLYVSQVTNLTPNVLKSL